MKEESARVNSQIAFSITHEESPQPLKYKLLNMLGLKDFLIDKFVFKRPSPQYSLSQDSGQLRVVSTPPVVYPPGYSQTTMIIEQEEHSIPAVVLRINQRQKCKGTLVYSHGNASDLGSALPFICKMAANYPFLDFVAYDYTGYGCSKKDSPSQHTINQDLSVLVKHLKIHDSELILWGFSLGCYPTVKYATQKQLKGVFLQSPLASLYSLLEDQVSSQQTFQNDSFSLIDHIADINSFLVIIHSHDDEVVPFAHSKALYDRHHMRNSNVYCFLLEVRAYKHSELHGAITAAFQNEVKTAVNKYLEMMVKKQVLSRAAHFQLSKDKYFHNLGKVRGAEVLDVQGQTKLSILQQRDLTDAHNTNSLAEIKANHEFEFDDIEKESEVAAASSMLARTGDYRDYFGTSEQAIEQTVASQIRQEDEIAEICK